MFWQSMPHSESAACADHRCRECRPMAESLHPRSAAITAPERTGRQQWSSTNHRYDPV